MYGIRHDSEYKESDYCREVLIGKGEVNWKKYLDTLEKIGYSGYLTIEREGTSTYESDIEKEVPYLKTLIAD